MIASSGLVVRCWVELEKTKEKQMKRIVVATEQQEQTEALYVDGTLITCEQKIYASEIAAAANGLPASIVARQVDLPDGECFPCDEAELVDHVEICGVWHMSNERLEELQLNLESARGGMNTGDIEAAVAAIEHYYTRKLIDGLREVECLIDHTKGVDGLHLNGDFSPWETLRTGGRFEGWLMAFDDALEIANKMEKGLA